MKKIIFLCLFVMFLSQNTQAQITPVQNTYILFEKTARIMTKSLYTDQILRQNNPNRRELKFRYSGSAYDMLYDPIFYTFDQNVYTVVPIASVSANYPNAMTHQSLGAFVSARTTNATVLHFSALPNIYIIEMLPALGVAHIRKVIYLPPYY